jgi:hypothetical protein
MKKILIGLGLALLVILLVVVLVLGWFGFIPGLSTALGAHTPVDFGITYTEADRLAALEQVGVEVKEMKNTDVAPAESIRFEGETKASTSFSSQQLTALEDGCRWKYCFMNNAQIRVNDDGSMELAGVLQLELVEGYALGLGYAPEDVATAMEYARKIFPSAPAIYLKGDNPTVTNNVVELNLVSAKIGRFSVPASYVAQTNDLLNGLAEDHLEMIPGFSITSASVKDGAVQFNGTYPAVQTFVTK